MLEYLSSCSQHCILGRSGQQANRKQSCGKICSEKLSHLTFIRMQTIVKFKYKIDPDFFLNFSICFTFKPDLAKCQASVSSKSRSVNSKLQPPPIVCQGKILSCLLRLFFCQQQVTVSPTQLQGPDSDCVIIHHNVCLKLSPKSAKILSS